MRDTSLAALSTSLRSAIEENPLAAGLIAAGLVWLVASRQRTVRRFVEEAGEAVADTAAPLTSGAQSAASTAGQAIGSAGETIAKTGRTAAGAIADGARSLSDSAQAGMKDPIASTAERARSLARASREQGEAMFSGLQDLFERQPLVLGGLGLVIGSAVAASFPASRIESDMFGDTSDALKQNLKERFADRADEFVDTSKQAFESLNIES